MASLAIEHFDNSLSWLVEFLQLTESDFKNMETCDTLWEILELPMTTIEEKTRRSFPDPPKLPLDENKQLHPNYSVRLQILQGLRELKLRGIRGETRRIRRERAIAHGLAEREKKEAEMLQQQAEARRPKRVGENHLDKKRQLKTNPIKEFLEGIDPRIAGKYIRALSSRFSTLEELDETAIFFIEEQGLKMMAWEKMALIRGIRAFRAQCGA